MFSYILKAPFGYHRANELSLFTMISQLSESSEKAPPKYFSYGSTDYMFGRKKFWLPKTSDIPIITKGEKNGRQKHVLSPKSPIFPTSPISPILPRLPKKEKNLLFTFIPGWNLSVLGLMYYEERRDIQWNIVNIPNISPISPTLPETNILSAENKWYHQYLGL